MNLLLLKRYLTIILISLNLTWSFPIGYESSEQYDTEPNNKTGILLDSWNHTFKMNPDEMGNYFQGDIMIDTTSTRSMTSNVSLLWPGGVVPYEIIGPYNDEGLQLLQWAMNEFETKTCIKLRPRQADDQNYLIFTNSKTGCWSFLGRQSGPQEINLQHPACMRTKRKGTVLHEIMHALGFVHEHTRPDRDKYIDILWHNISPSMWDNFKKTNESDVSSLGIDYDYGSLMQYSMFAFSTDGYNKTTLRPKVNELMYKYPNQSYKLGQRSEFSEKDLLKIKKLYCSESVDEEESTLPTEESER